MQLVNLVFSNTCILDVFSLSRTAFAFCISQVFSIISLRDYLVQDSTKAAKPACPSFLLSSAAVYNSVAQ